MHICHAFLYVSGMIKSQMAIQEKEKVVAAVACNYKMYIRAQLFKTWLVLIQD